jgi:hypothetical protein
LAVVAGRAALPVLALVRAVPIATGAAAALTGTSPALAVIVASADARVWTFDAAFTAALVAHVARRATLVLDARGAFAIVARRAALGLLATVRAVPIAAGTAAALAGASPALAVIVAAAPARVRAFHATLAATPAREVARGATLLIDACLELSAGVVADAILPECGTRKRKQPETNHRKPCYDKDATRRPARDGKPYAGGFLKRHRAPCSTTRELSGQSSPFH